MKRFAIILLSLVSFAQPTATFGDPLRITVDEKAGTISVFRESSDKPILTQNARADFRPYIHPIVAPDGKGVLTESQPSHHRHQTGLYWGFTRVNGRDFFHHPEGDYWRRVSFSALVAKSQGDDGAVQWQTVYDLLDAEGKTLLTETQIWTMRVVDGEYILDQQWTGAAKQMVTVSKYDYGGLFLRMPWRRGIRGEAVNAARQRGAMAEGQRAPWLDVGMQVDGRDDLAHIAIFDHSKNPGFPQPWRVDGQLGVGPVRARLGDWSISEGADVVFRHQLRVYTGELNDLELTHKWGQFSGQRGTWALWGLAQQEGRAAKFLTPEEAVEKMSVRQGFDVNLWAGEPLMTQPMAFCWDDRGRLWIAENRDYESRGRGFSNSGDSRIVILEDTDNDGRADSRKVFLEGIPFPSAIAVGLGGLWLGAPPNLLFVPDKDENDQADLEDIEVRLTGWGIRDRHETLNSFHWGPDGWLYGCQGFATPSRVGKPEGNGKLYRHQEAFPRDIPIRGDGVDINGGVWRYHPIKDRFEVVAHGFSNPWGIDYDAKGQFFITACVIPHLWHVIPGGIYHRQGGRHFNPYVYSDIRTIADHRHRSAHGGARVYLSDAFPAEYRNQIFMANIHEHAVLADVLEPRGSGFVGRHGEDFLMANNAQWIGFSMEIGPNGALYVLDWHDADICGKEVLNKDTGRIFRIAPKESHAVAFHARNTDLVTLTNPELVTLQLSPSAWHARRARTLLQHRAAQGHVQQYNYQQLKQILATHANDDYRLRALWALHVMDGISGDELTKLLGDKDQYIRGWAIQLLCEDGPPAAAAVSQFAKLASDDPSAVVRLYLAAALQRLGPSQRWAIANQLVGHAEDADDHNVPKMIWFAIEPLVATGDVQVDALLAASRIPHVTRLSARRLADANKTERVIANLHRVPDNDEHLLLGLRDALEGRFDVNAPKNWDKTFDRLVANGGPPAAIAKQLAAKFADTITTKELVAVVRNRKADVDARTQALRGLAARRRPEGRGLILELLDDPQLQREAIRAMAAFDDRRMSSTLLRRYKQFDDSAKLDAIHTLASRPSYGWALTQSIRRGDIPRNDIPAYVARLLRRVVGNGFVEVWGPIDELAADKTGAFQKYRTLLTADALEKADPSRGRGLFQKTCATCHKLHGTGRQIGPDITGANRSNLEYLLGNILTPSAVIQDAYRMQLVLTDEGRVHSGILAGETEREILLRVAGRDDAVRIAKSAIESHEIAPVSMMPEGLLKTLSDTDVLDLVKYLQSPRQVPLPDAGQ